jgi:L-amino acid N-acyltransferase YncA
MIRAEAAVTNLASIGLHEALGFENLGAFTAKDGDENVALRKSLS